jgi:uncharacterized protein YndB with AHSA1/START domain
MGPVSATVTIDVPRERVHPLLADLAIRPAFTDHFIDELRLERLASSGVGAAARFRIPDRGLWVETVIEESSPPHRLAERGGAGRLDHMPVHTVWELVEAAAPRACEVTVTFVIETTGPFDRPGHERWYRRQWARALDRLKAIAESDQEPSRVAVAGGDRLGI